MAELFPYAPQRDVYRLLEVPPDAAEDEIVVACRRLARTFHPDRNASARAHEEMQVVNAVRGLLTDPHARAAYDAERRRWLAELARHSATGRIEPDPAPLAWRDRLRLPAPPERISRFAAAIGVGLRAALGGLLPARCSRCRAVIDRDDAYCLMCGARLLAARGRGQA
jgi:curved DNA-binding protein CbpA